MRKTLALLAIVALAATGALFIQRLNQDEHYKRLLANGEAALAAGQSYVAIEAFSGALALRPSSMVAFYRRGEAYAIEGQNARAILDLQEARRLAPDAPEPLEALGRLFDHQGNPAEAADWFAQAAERLKDADPALLYTLALARYRAGTPASARDPLRRALARNDSMAEAHYLLGLVYRDAQQPDEAMASLERAVRLAPSLLAAREELADLYRERGQLADEARELGALASLDQQLDRQIALALAHMRAGRYPEALDTLKRPDDVATSDSRVALTTGRIYLARAERTGDRASVTLALTSLERALGGTARRSEGLALFGRALYLTGNYAGSERLLKDAIATTPIDTEAFAFLADAAERVSHPDVARDALLGLDALEGDTVSADVRAARARRIGGLAVAAGDGRTGVEYLTLAIKAGLTDASTLGLLARAQWQTGNRDDARRTLGEALALDARDADLRRLSRVIR